MDSNDLERERGIPSWRRTRGALRGTHVNIVDTPGHAGLRRANGARAVDGRRPCAAAVDAVDGPMPQTRCRNPQRRWRSA